MDFSQPHVQSAVVGQVKARRSSQEAITRRRSSMSNAKTNATGAGGRSRSYSRNGVGLISEEMSSSKKYLHLPDLDENQKDLYETPDLADDISTLPTTASEADDEQIFGDDADSDDPSARRLLKPSDARKALHGSSIDATDVDFSDRVSRKQRSYTVVSKSNRRMAAGTRDDSDHDEGNEETIEKKLARLRREVEEVKATLTASVQGENSPETKARVSTQITSEGSHDTKISTQTALKSQMRSLENLSRVLEGMQIRRGVTEDLVVSKLSSSLRAVAVAGIEADTEIDLEGPASASFTVKYSPLFKRTHTLSMISDIDVRLTILEKALGLSPTFLSSLDPSMRSKSSSQPVAAVFPILEHLQKQISLISSTSGSALDAVSRRVKMLTSDAEKLADARKVSRDTADAARRNTNAAYVTPAPEADSGDPRALQARNIVSAAEQAERDSKINALYGILPTIESLSPLLPVIIDRLRSLRAVHADAGRAAENLSGLENNQEEMSREIQQWRTAIEAVEELMNKSDAVMKGNFRRVESLVKGLEGKTNQLRMS